ncbi:unnamed protein product [Dracunculus medinensis]|uniref:Uncharacterized protein n=1 Tax=Dracunculus medinensis TaxID=318479 RepID=A0A0N4UA91_DRAME|nr:unnamed protein product [Dracunculus medinensis]
MDFNNFVIEGLNFAKRLTSRKSSAGTPDLDLSLRIRIRIIVVTLGRMSSLAIPRAAYNVITFRGLV